MGVFPRRACQYVKVLKEIYTTKQLFHWHCSLMELFNNNRTYIDNNQAAGTGQESGVTIISLCFLTVLLPL